MHAVDIAKDRFGLDNILTIHGQFNAEDSMGSRVLRPEIENKSLVRVALDRDGHGVKSFKSG